jgi:hypothetical protein
MKKAFLRFEGIPKEFVIKLLLNNIKGKLNMIGHDPPEV